jgi:threonine dehydrogenase-like Zn-dependent dehydrogenase
MKALLLEAEWKPKEGYRFSEKELKTKSTYNGSMAFYNPTLKMVDIPVPEPDPGQVLVEVKATGVCGSDVHMYQKLEDGYTAYPGHCKFPVVLGHEWSGTVVELGKGVRNIRKGDIVAVEEMQWCGECTACRSGLFDQCTNLEEIGFTVQGAFTEYVAVPEKHCWPINSIAEAYGDDEKAFEIGAMVEPCCVAYNGMFISAGGFLPGSNVVVAGCGPIGLMSIALARAAGAAKVIVMEPSAPRREMAIKLGADFAFDPLGAEEEGNRPADIIMEQTRGDGVMFAVEAAAAGPKTYPVFEEVLTPNGDIMQAGMGAERVPISVLKLQWQRLHIHGSVGHTGGIFPYAIRLLAAKRMDISPLVTARFSLDQAIEAIKRAEALEDVKVMVKQ